MPPKGFAERRKQNKVSRFKGKVYLTEDGNMDPCGGPTEDGLEKIERSKNKESSFSEDGSSDRKESDQDETSGEESTKEKPHEKKTFSSKKAAEMRGKHDDETSDDDDDSEEEDDSDEDDSSYEIYNPNRMPQGANPSSQWDIMGSHRSNRQEREQEQKEQAQNRYWENYKKGLNDLATSDYKRLQEIKALREEARVSRLAKVAQKSASSPASSTVKKPLKSTPSAAKK